MPVVQSPPTKQTRLAFGQRPRNLLSSSRPKFKGKNQNRKRLLQKRLSFLVDESKFCRCSNDEPTDEALPEQVWQPRYSGWQSPPRHLGWHLEAAAESPTSQKGDDAVWDQNNCLVEALLYGAERSAYLKAVSDLGKPASAPAVRKFLYNFVCTYIEELVTIIKIGDFAWVDYVMEETGMNLDQYAEYLASGGHLGVPDAAIINYVFPEMGITIMDNTGHTRAVFEGVFMLHVEFDGICNYDFVNPFGDYSDDEDGMWF